MTPLCPPATNQHFHRRLAVSLRCPHIPQNSVKTMKFIFQIYQKFSSSYFKPFIIFVLTRSHKTEHQTQYQYQMYNPQSQSLTFPQIRQQIFCREAISFRLKNPLSTPNSKSLIQVVMVIHEEISKSLSDQPDEN